MTPTCPPEPCSRPIPGLRGSHGEGGHTEAIVTPCIEWQGKRDKDGYGRVEVNGREIAAHRVAWAKENGLIPAGLLVLHSCDNPPCINIDHLRLGTHKDNMADMVARGRSKFPRPWTAMNLRQGAMCFGPIAPQFKCGHSSAEWNTKFRGINTDGSKTRRGCLACHRKHRRQADRNRYWRNKQIA